VEARVLVGARTAQLFTAHKLVNVSTGGFFIAGRTYPLGMAFDVTLRFEGSPETMSTRGKVVLESAGTDPRQPRGTGVQLNLSSAERSFLQSFIGSVVAKQQNKAR
jgi:Tfp pilus assembly protein PilZ